MDSLVKIWYKGMEPTSLNYRDDLDFREEPFQDKLLEETSVDADIHWNSIEQAIGADIYEEQEEIYCDTCPSTAVPDHHDYTGQWFNGDLNATSFCQGSSGHSEHFSDPGVNFKQDSRRGPMERLSLQIGKRVVRLKIVNINKISSTYCTSESNTCRVPTCGQCRINFTSREDCLLHQKNVHSFGRIFTCVICGMSFTTKMSLNVHIRQHGAHKSFQCNLCQKTFARAANLRSHLQLHKTGHHQFCNVCGRCFKTSASLEQHQGSCLAQFNGDFTGRPFRYQCTYCDKLFYHRRDKLIHERVHTGEKPYQCGYCGRGFTQSQGLTIHIRIHTGERPYNCQQCGRTYRDNSSLRKHEYKHHMPNIMIFDDGISNDTMEERSLTWNRQ